MLRLDEDGVELSRLLALAQVSLSLAKRAAMVNDLLACERDLWDAGNYVEAAKRVMAKLTSGKED